jgi:sorbitol-specific phosphotransferase system component IIA
VWDPGWPRRRGIGDDLGHIVLYVNQPDQKLLPGAVLATGDIPDLKTGDTIEFRSSSS